LTVDTERALRDKMIVSLEKGRNSVRPLTELAYQNKAIPFLNELRKVDTELNFLIDKIRSSPSGIDRKQLTQAMKFDVIYSDSCELVADQLSNFYGKLLKADLNFQSLYPELLYLRKIVIDVQNAYGGRMNALSQANLISYSIERKLSKEDMKGMGETLEDLRQIAQENDEIANRLANTVISQAPEITKQMEALKTSAPEIIKQMGAPKTSALQNALQKWTQIAGMVSTAATVTGSVRTTIVNARGIATGVIDIATLLGGMAIPGFPVVAMAAKAILGILGRSSG